MSQLETNPLINKTTATIRQNQSLQMLSEQKLLAMPIDPFKRLSLNLETDQADIPGVANMDKWIENFAWRTSQTPNTEIFAFELTLDNILDYAPLGTDVQTLINMESVTITIEDTFNPFYQGCLLFFYEPTPVRNYNFVVQGAAALTNRNYFQLASVKRITPKNRQPNSITVPINIPFNFFQITNPIASTSNWIMNYSFGRVRLVVNVPLSTASPIPDLSLKASITINGYETAGNRFR